MDRRFCGSSAALILGSLFLMTAASRGQDAAPQVLSAVGVIVGALAFRSLKRRRLGLCDGTPLEGVWRKASPWCRLWLSFCCFSPAIVARFRNHVISSWELLADVNPHEEVPYQASRGYGPSLISTCYVGSGTCDRISGETPIASQPARRGASMPHSHPAGSTSGLATGRCLPRWYTDVCFAVRLEPVERANQRPQMPPVSGCGNTGQSRSISQRPELPEKGAYRQGCRGSPDL